jgi:UDP-N-acetylglucosamine--N-acetylmuramyl-(pentapeptide) pyrophosphoryl-undecaprenol N-acetylglucosamine transferase
MKVLIMPCGIGIGHASRCVAIAKKLQEEGVEVAFASYGSGYEMLKSYPEYKTIKLPDIKFYGDAGELDIKYTAKKSIGVPFIFLKSIYYESRLIKKFKPDLILADSHFSVPITAKLKGVPCVMITNELTLNFSDLYPDDKTVEYLENGLKKFVKDVCNLCKAVLVPDVPGSIEIPQKLEKIVFHTGPLLKNDPEKMPCRDELRKELGFQISEKIVLVTVGGSEFGIELLKLICIASTRINCDKLIIVTGPQIESDFIFESNKIIKKKFLENMMDWMKISDVIVSLAGHTTIMEVMSLGIPNIVVPIDNHPEQLKNSINVAGYGISIVEDIKKLSPEKMAEDINSLLGDPNLQDKAKIAREKFSKYNGTCDAVELIMGFAEGNKQVL